MWYLLYVTLTFDHTHKRDLRFPRWNFENNHIWGITPDITLVHGSFFPSFICFMRWWWHSWGKISNAGVSVFTFYLDHSFLSIQYDPDLMDSSWAMARCEVEGMTLHGWNELLI